MLLLLTPAAMALGVEIASAEPDSADEPEAYDVYDDDEVAGPSGVDEADGADAADEAIETGEAIGSDETESPGEADDPPAESAPDGVPQARELPSSQELEELLVTAKRGSQNLQDLPESVSSFSATELLDKGITDFNTLQFSVPSLFSGGGLTKITLRGVGGEVVGPGVDPGFAVHVNSVFSSRETTGLIDYYDIERVDVFRGPQGTEWGRNSTGGALNVVTKRAAYEWDTAADIEYGRFNKGRNGVRFRGMFNAPLIEDQLAVRVAMMGDYNDGVMLLESEENRQWVSDSSLGSIRLSLAWDPHEDVNVDFIASWLQSGDAGFGRKFDGDYESTPGFVWPGAGAGYNFDGALENPKDPYLGTANDRQHQDALVWTTTLLTGWELGSAKLDSITGYQGTNFFLDRDQDTSSLPISTLELNDKSRQISQEFIFNTVWERPYNLTAGAIYQYDWTPRTEIEIRNAQDTAESVNWTNFPSLGPPPALFPSISLVDGCPPTSPFDPAGFPASCPPVKDAGVESEVFINPLAKAKNHIFGLYASASWEIIEALTLSIGGRFSYTKRDWNDKSFSQTYVGVLDPFGIQVVQRGVHQTEVWQAGTWKVSVDYQLLQEHLLWASVGTGSRAGGFNFSQEESFGDESILAVEAGIKNMFFDNRMMVNVSGFWYDWEDPQIAGTENALPIVRNAPSAISYGIELEFRALPTDNLAINGTFGWLEAFYNDDHFSGDISVQDLTETNPALRVTPINIKGKRLPRSPRFTVSLGAQYTFELGQWGSLMPRVDFYYRDSVNFRQYGNPKDVAKSYTRTDVRLVWRAEDGRWWFEAFGRNLENEAVKNNQELIANVYRAHVYASPISGGFRVGYQFQ